MKIIIGIDNISDVAPLFKAGASDFFCGLVGDEKNFSNHRPNTTRYNLKNVSELKKTLKVAHKLKARLFLVLNDNVITNKEVEKFAEKIKLLDGLNLDAFIVSDISFIYLCQKLGIKTKLHLSSLALCLNSESIKFYQDLNISRIIVPQQTTPLEYQQAFAKKDNIETEVFFHLYNNCNNIDGICRYHNRDLLTITNKKIPLMPCIFKPKFNSFFGLKSSFYTKMESLLRTPSTFNYLEYLYDFYNLGVSTVKLGIRGYPINEKIKRVTYLKELIDLIKTGVTKKEFLSRSKIISNKYENIYWSEKHFLSQQYTVNR